MRTTRQHIAKFMAFVVALQILNLSIFTQDFEPLHIKHKPVIGEFNEINSIVEYVAEVVLDYKNAFPEFEKEGNKDLQPYKHIAIKLITADELLTSKPPANTPINYLLPVNDRYDYLFYKEINPPPPKA